MTSLCSLYKTIYHSNDDDGYGGLIMQSVFAPIGSTGREHEQSHKIGWESSILSDQLVYFVFYFLLRNQSCHKTLWKTERRNENVNLKWMALR